LNTTQMLTKPKDLKAWAYETIKDDILNQRVEPGEQLRIEELSKKLSISRTPIREALLRLESEGLVRSASRVGFFVRDLTQQGIRELFELRELIEGYAAEKAAPTLTDEDLAQINDLQQKATASFEQDDFLSFNKYEIALHDFLIGHSGNTQLLRMIEGLKDLTYRERQYALRSRENVNKSIQEHRVLIEALGARDGMQAGKSMREHLRNVRDRLLCNLDLPESDSKESKKG
jgi:DNA-binding GntR family transcriptional regulator